MAVWDLICAFWEKRMHYIEIGKLKREVTFRTMGGPNSREHLWAGVLHKAGVTVDLKGSGTYALVYVIRGRGHYAAPDGTAYELKPGSLFQRHPNVPHTTCIDPDSDWLECFIDFGPATYNMLAATRVIRTDEYVYSIEPDHRIEEECYRLKIELDQCEEHELPNMLAQFIKYTIDLLKRCHCPKSDNKIERMVQTTCGYLREHCNEKVDLKQFCKANGWGYDNLRKHFRRSVGMPPVRYQIGAKTDRAIQLLSTTSLSIEEIADRLNYCSAFEFSKQFKNVIGIAPKFYRNQQPCSRLQSIDAAHFQHFPKC